MLTPEERLRIEEEERRRIAEEQYRAEVRAKLRSDSGAPAKRDITPWLIGGAVALIVGIVAAVVWSNSGGGTGGGDHGGSNAASKLAPVAKTRYVPVTDKIASGQIQVKAGGHADYRIAITPEMQQPKVSGSFTASGGSGNDIEAVIADEMNYTNWVNGHRANVFWQTEGQQTTGKLNVQLAPGTYYLVFSNKFSAITDKVVVVEIELNYKKAETYYE